MADAERVSTAQEQVDDAKEATLPLTPVSDSDGFKHGDHEDHPDAPNGTPTPVEPANDAGEAEKAAEVEDLPKEEPTAEAAPVVSPSPMKPKATVSVDARTRKTSLQVGKADPKVAAASLRKTSFAKPASAVPAAAVKRSPLSTSSSAPRPSVAGGAKSGVDTAATRRTSVAPALGHSSKPSVSSTATKPSASSTHARPSVGGAATAKPASRVTSGPKPAGPPSRGSVVSPTATATTRPAVSGVRARPSEVGAGTTLASKRTSAVRTSTTGTLASRGATPTLPKAGSPAPKQDEELVAKHREAIDELAKREEHIATLEERILSLQATLEQRQTDAANHESSLAELKAVSESASAARDAVDAELASLKESANISHSEKEKLEALLEDTRSQLAEAVSKVQNTESLHTDLSSQVSELEATISQLQAANDTAKLEITAFKEHASTQGDAVASAAIEHEALLKARADLEAIRTESESLAASQKIVTEQNALQIKELEAKLSSAEASLTQLQSEISTLQSERDDLKSRISELEVEVLEIRETNEVDADDHAKELAKLKDTHAQQLVDNEARLQDELKKATLSYEEAMKKWEEATAAAGKEHSASLENALKSAQESATEASQKALTTLEASHAKSVEEIKARFAQELAETKEAHEQSMTLVAEEMSRLQTELGNQEEKYAAKVRDVKTEHDKLVEEAYQRAKAEADAKHSKDLNDLRTRSDAAIAEVRAGHHTELQNVNAAHEETLGAEVRSLEKKINSLTVESKAALDDLAKAKSTIATQTAELEALREQMGSTKEALEKARAAPSTAAPSEELDAVRNELRSVKDDFDTLRAVHQSSQENFAAMVNNHNVELEEAAKGRVQALAALESKHQAEKAQHVEEMAEIQRLLDDERDTKERALASLNNQQIRTPPITPRFNHVGGGSSKDELERLYHAHNAKLAQLENDHRQAIAKLTISLVEAQDGMNQANEELERKNMELNFQGEELNDTQDEVKQLQDEVERLKALVH